MLRRQTSSSILAQRRLASRAERLRGGRSSAKPLAELSGTAGKIVVRLSFAPEGSHKHGEQLFVFYSGAKAYFGFPCPYGGCDGIYDLAVHVQDSLDKPGIETFGSMKCVGSRSRFREPAQSCDLEVRFTVLCSSSEEIASDRVRGRQD